MRHSTISTFLAMPCGLVAVLFVLVAPPVAGAEQKRPPKETKAKVEPPGPSLCPESISVEQRVTGSPAGWDATHSDAKPRLAMVTFFDGPPAGRASLKYDSEQKEKREWVATWNLQPNSRGYWVQCSYDNTTGVLSRRLPEGVTACKVTYERGTQVASGLPAVKHVACK